MRLVHVACRDDLAIFQRKKRLGVPRPLQSPAHNPEIDAVGSNGRATPAKSAGRHKRGRGDGRAGGRQELAPANLLHSYPFFASFAHVSFKVMVRLKTGLPGWLSLSSAKYARRSNW